MATAKKASTSKSLPPEELLICGRKRKVIEGTATRTGRVQDKLDAAEILARAIDAADERCSNNCTQYANNYKCKSTCPDKSSRTDNLPLRQSDVTQVSSGNRLTVTVTKRKRVQVSCKMILRPSVKKVAAKKK